MYKGILPVATVASLAAFLVACACDYHTTERMTLEAESIAKETQPIEQYKIIETVVPDIQEEQEEIRNEIFYGELEEVALIVQAEAGNQDELGKRYVADAVFNRVDDDDFPDTIYDVIYQMDPIQFATTVNGAMGKAGYTITEDVYQIVLEEYDNRTNSDIIYFRTDKYHECGTPAFKHGEHYFSTK